MSHGKCTDFANKLITYQKNFGVIVEDFFDSYRLQMNPFFDATEEIFYTVRDVAIKLFNEKHLIDYPLKITRMLEQNFSYLPKLAELIRKDIKFLEEAKERQPTQAFLNAKAELENILAAIDKNLHFEEGFKRANLEFYQKNFKADLVFTLIRVINHSACKPDEQKFPPANREGIF